MKRMRRRIGKFLLWAVCVLFVALAGLTIYHQTAKTIEASRLTPTGRLYEVDGHMLHVRVMGEAAAVQTLVLLSGSGTAAPVYDFQALAKRLSRTFKVAIVERSGYGYSPTSGASRDIDTVMEETRGALAQADIQGPYILMPHSIAGIEALYWAQCHPQEIAAIIGLDMTVPQAKDDIPDVPLARPLLSIIGDIGIQRIPFIYPIEYIELSDDEVKQAKYLTYRNAFDLDIRNELTYTQANIDKIDLSSIQDLPILAFVSNDRDSQKEHEAFSEQIPCELYRIDAPHYIHQFAPTEICEVATRFIEDTVLHSLDHGPVAL